jgi:hypothetical protein
VDEFLQVMRDLWRGEPTDHSGEFVDLPPVKMGAPPSEPIPVVVGGSSEPALRRAARHDGWYGPAVGLAESIACRDRIEEYRREFGRAEAPFRYYVRIGGDPEPRSIQRYRSAGFDRVVIAPWRAQGGPLDLQGRLDGLGQVREALDGVAEFDG